MRLMVALTIAVLALSGCEDEKLTVPPAAGGADAPASPIVTDNEKIDAGDVGAGHNVTAFYELIPVGQSVPGPGQVDELKYQAEPATRGGATDEILTAKLRYKQPDGDTSVRMDVPLTAGQLDREPGRDFRFASAVAGFGMILRDSPLRGSFGYADVLNLAEPAIGEDPGGYRREFINLVRNAQALAGKTEPAANRE